MVTFAQCKPVSALWSLDENGRCLGANVIADLAIFQGGMYENMAGTELVPGFILLIATSVVDSRRCGACALSDSHSMESSNENETQGGDCYFDVTRIIVCCSLPRDRFKTGTDRNRRASAAAVVRVYEVKQSPSSKDFTCKALAGAFSRVPYLTDTVTQGLT